MITYWRILPAFLAVFLPWIIALPPVLNKPMAIFGVYRQTMANYFINLLPEGKQFQYMQFFNNGDFIDEFLAVVPMNLLLSLLIAWSVFIVGSVLISVNNFIVKKQQQAVVTAHRK